MSIEKKSLISNRNASKKANLTRASVTQVSSTKTRVNLVRPLIHSKVANTLIRAKIKV